MIAAPAHALLAGSGRERGRAHGEELRPRIEAALARWNEDAARRSGRTAREHVAAFLAGTSFAAACERHTPDLLDEVRGIAEGSGAGFERILAYNLMDEEWWWSSARGGACSLVGVAAEDGRPALLAQNMDLPPVMDGGQVLLRLRRPEGLEAALLSAAGMIGLCGVNSAGVGVCVNTLPALRRSPRGLPVAFVLRGLLEQRSAAEAEGFLRAVPHASGQHYALAAGGRVCGWECSAGAVAACAADAGRLWHTNHPRTSGDLEPGLEPDGGALADSQLRGRAVEAALESVDDLDACQRLLADRRVPLCVPPDAGRGWMTFGSVAMELGSPPRVRVALGPPDRTPWQELRLSDS